MCTEQVVRLGAPQGHWRGPWVRKVGAFLVLVTEGQEISAHKRHSVDFVSVRVARSGGALAVYRAGDFVSVRVAHSSGALAVYRAGDFGKRPD